MIKYLYYIILFLFFVGAILIAIINKKRPDINSKKNWLKYIVYLIIVNTIILSIIINSIIFHYIVIGIIIVCFVELILVIRSTGMIQTGIITLVIFSVLSAAFFKFSLLNSNIILFTYLLITLFDAFCQLTGQLTGKTKILPKTSPNKTLEGLIGGFVMVVLASLILQDLLEVSTLDSIFLGIGTALFAFTGDLLASVCKRNFGIKDFSNFIPAHGGFLDRFDSLIFASVLLFFLTHFKYL